MIVTSIRDFRDKATAYLKKKEPVLITRNGKVAGLFLRLEDGESLPLDVRKEILSGFGKSISAALKKKGVTEEKLLADFKAHRKARRRQ